MSQAYKKLRVARSDEGVVSVLIDAPPMNLIGPESGARPGDSVQRTGVR